MPLSTTSQYNVLWPGQIKKGEIQLSAIERRLVLMKEKVSGMEDADLSKL